MATAAHAKITQWDTAVDLTDVDVNPGAAPTATPRQGGFMLRNRINFANVSSGSDNAMTVNAVEMTTLPTTPFTVLQVPERVFVKELMLYAVEGQTVPGFSTTQIASTSLTNSDLDTWTMSFGAKRNRKDVTNASYVAASDLVQIITAPAGTGCAVDGVVGGDVFGNLLTKISTNNTVWVDAFDAIDGSLATSAEPMQTAKSIRNTGALITSALSQHNDGEYFPYGGLVNMFIGPWNVAESSGVTAVESFYASSVGATIDLTGVWEIQAQCWYVPE
jgi:hypothetical protein